MKNKKQEKLPLIYLLGMPIIFIVANFLARTHVEFLGSPLYFSVLLYPLTYLLSGLIVKKAELQKKSFNYGSNINNCSINICNAMGFIKFNGLFCYDLFIFIILNRTINIYIYL